MNAIAKVSAKKKMLAPIEKNEKARMKAFYDEQLNLAPILCEECNDRLVNSTFINPRTIISHILPKRKEHGFPSVDTHPSNVMFLCGHDHNCFDLKGKDFILKMKLLPVIKERVQVLLPLLTPEEFNRVPDYLL